MHFQVFATPQEAILAAADRLKDWLGAWRGVVHWPNLVLAGGQTPQPVYAEVGRRFLETETLRVFALDEYVGVPGDDPRTCTNLLRRTVKEPWRVPDGHFHGLSSNEADALSSVVAHEQRIEDAGGLDGIVLGLGVNGHLGFNEPGSARDSAARLVPLEPSSIEANRLWFSGEYAPRVGATLGLRTILAARRVLLLAFGPAKAHAVRAVMRGNGAGSDGERYPAAWLREHPHVHFLVDKAAAAKLRTT